MADLMDAFAKGLQGQAVEAISKKLGLDPKTVQAAVGVGLPMIMSGLAKNAQDEKGAESINKALEKDHDGSIWDNITGFLGNETVQSAGASILNHVFGAKQEAAQKNVSKTTGLDAQTSMQIMQMLAPVVMGYLGKKKKEEGLDATGVANVLTTNQKQLQEKAPEVGMLTKFLDSDGDGEITDDLLNIGSSLISNFFSSDKDDKKK